MTTARTRTATRWMQSVQHNHGVCCVLVLAFLASACAVERASDDPEQAEAMEASTEQALSPGACTAVTLTSPRPGFTGAAGEPIPLSAVATCPAGSTPEYQYWVKLVGAANWTILGAYVAGASSFTPPVPGNWAVTAVTRATGAPESYQARAAAVAGTIGPANQPPSAADDVISTTENVAGSVDVAANDADPNGDPLAVASFTSPVSGAVAFVGTVATYTPAAGFVGSDSFTYTISDGRGGTATATVAIDVANRPPTAGDDTLVTSQDTPGSVNVLANDDDPDPDALSVIAFTQGANGVVTIASGVATYTPAPGFVGSDSFTYTIDDGHGATATATVSVTVISNVPACTISIAGPATATFGEPIHLTATAACTTGPVQIQWLRRVNSAYVVVQPFSASPTLDFVADAVGNMTFFAVARAQGATPVEATSSFVTVKVIDNAPQCTTLRMVTPTNTQTLTVGVAQTLTAQATCPAGAVPEYQFWVKPVGAANWIILPGFTTGSGSWAPPSPGAWAIRAVVRTVGAHVNYQIGSMAVTVDVVP